jgi:hypothetical protein
MDLERLKRLSRAASQVPWKVERKRWPVAWPWGQEFVVRGTDADLCVEMRNCIDELVERVERAERGRDKFEEGIETAIVMLRRGTSSNALWHKLVGFLEEGRAFEKVDDGR